MAQSTAWFARDKRGLSMRLRLVITLAVVALVALYLGTREPADPAAELIPAQQQLDKARALEQQMQQQADDQRKAIDAAIEKGAADTQ
jgi:CHASE3 domain sensor protein